MTTTPNDSPAPSTLAPLLLDYFCATSDDIRDDALDAIFDHLDSTPPSDTAELTLMLTACAADADLAHRIRRYLTQPHRP